MSKTKRHFRKKTLLSLVLSMVLLMGMAIPAQAAETKTPAKANQLQSPRILFDAEYYADHNPDVKAAFGYNAKKLYQHFVKFGFKEGRVISPFFDLKAYREGNPDLEAAFGDDWAKYVTHYLRFGIYENANGQRSSAGILFNPIVYAAAYPDIQAAFGSNLQAITAHYLEYGKSEGRTAGVSSAAAPAASSGSGSSSGSSSAGTSASGGSSNTEGGSNEPTVTEHQHDWSAQDGTCAGTGTCPGCPDREGHADILTSEQCGTCGAAGTKEPHTKDSEHTKASFDETTGECTEGCGMTLTQFQNTKCSHDSWNEGECTVCGKVCTHTSGWANLDGVCTVCGTECTHNWTSGTCTTCGKVCSHVWSDPDGDDAGKCSVCGESCDVDHTKVDNDSTCPTCGVTGEKEGGHDNTSVHTKDDFNDDGSCKKNTNNNCAYTLTDFQNDCSHQWSDGVCVKCDKECGDKGTHDQLHKDQKCATCDVVGTVNHTFVNGTCSCTATCTAATCPDKESHAATVTTGDEKCGTCGLTLAQFQATCDHDWDAGVCTVCTKECAHASYTNGVCDECEIPCSKTDAHENIHEGNKCDICQIDGIADHTFVDGTCSCTATCTAATCPDKESHATAVTTGEGKCGTCGLTLAEFQTTCDHDWDAGVCTVCTKECAHAGYTDGVCDECEMPCSKTATHENIHEGKKCDICQIDGTADHTFVDGTCSCTATCTAATCPDKESHATAVTTGEGKCGTCGLTLAEFQETCEHASYTDGVCDVCTKECSKKGEHKDSEECSECHYGAA